MQPWRLALHAKNWSTFLVSKSAYIDETDAVQQTETTLSHTFIKSHPCRYFCPLAPASVKEARQALWGILPRANEAT